MTSLYTKSEQIIVGLDLFRHGSARINRGLRNCHVFLCALWLTMFSANVQADPPTEYEVKAAFVHNIAKFVEWPASVSAQGTLRLCILDQEAFGEAAENLLRDKPVGSKVWEVVPLSTRASLKECKVLFIGAAEAGELPRLLDILKGSPVLTVGDTGGYAEQGVIINFYREQDKVRFEINKDAAERAGLKISSHLLKLARIVQNNGGVK